MLFPTVKKVNLSKNEIIIVELFEGKRIAGVVDEVCDGYFYMRASNDPYSYRERFSFKVDRVIKLN